MKTSTTCLLSFLLVLLTNILIMTHRRHENLRGYIKKVVVPGVWVNVSSDDANEKFSLLGALHIPGLTTSKDLKMWLRMEGVKNGMLIGYEEFYANTSGKKFLIAHGHKPVRNYWDQPDDIYTS